MNEPSKTTDGKTKLYKNPEDSLKIELGNHLILIMNGKALKQLTKTFQVQEGFIK